jgi:thiosulfate dehydrogenase [quinone] large subunit
MNSTSTKNIGKAVVSIEDPPVARFLFNNVWFSWFWLIIRILAGVPWVQAGWDKVTNPAWVGPQAGTQLAGFINNALKAPAPAHPSLTISWLQTLYTGFLQHVVLPATPFWSPVVAFGELLVGIALILGIFTGIAAFFGGFMNVNYLLAGTVSTNPILFIFATWLVMAWKTAGWLGLDHWILPLIGVPGRPGKVFAPKASEKSPQAN